MMITLEKHLPWILINNNSHVTRDYTYTAVPGVILKFRVFINCGTIIYDFLSALHEYSNNSLLKRHLPDLVQLPNRIEKSISIIIIINRIMFRKKNDFSLLLLCIHIIMNGAIVIWYDETVCHSHSKCYGYGLITAGRW